MKKLGEHLDLENMHSVQKERIVEAINQKKEMMMILH
jgi:hypothetical protein